MFNVSVSALDCFKLVASIFLDYAYELEIFDYLSTQ